jgi:putative zinc finger protein
VTTHEEFLDLAAAAIDFELDPDESAALDQHLAGCDSCRRTVEAFREDAAMIAYGPAPRLAPGRSVAILAAALRSPKSGPPVRLLAVAGLVALVGGGLLAVGLGIIGTSRDPLVAVVTPSSGDSSAHAPSIGASTEPTASGGATQPPPAATPRPVGSPTAGAVQVRGDGQELGTLIQMAPAPDGDFYVSIPASDGTVVGRLDDRGKPAPGWPVFLRGASPCGLLLPVEDGSLRVVCSADDLVSELGNPNVRAFALDARGRPLAGWPVELPCCFTGRMIGDELTLYTRHPGGGDYEPGQQAGQSWVVAVAADGTVRNGAAVPFILDCCLDTWSIGPNGIAYGTDHYPSTGAAITGLAAVGLGGIPEGYPLQIEGNASKPAFDAAGRIYLTLGSPDAVPARTLVFDPDSRALEVDSGDMNIAATSEWRGAGADIPGAPIVGADGTTFVIGESGGTVVMGLDPTGRVMAGWPYQSDLGLAGTGFCPPQDTGCGGFRAAPAVGSGNVLYILQEAATPAAGGRIVAIGPDGRVVDGWPVQLRRPGSEFWSIVAGPDGRVYVLAIEPEPNGAHSATILAIAPDSTRKFNVTVVEP